VCNKYYYTQNQDIDIPKTYPIHIIQSYAWLYLDSQYIKIRKVQPDATMERIMVSIDFFLLIDDNILFTYIRVAGHTIRIIFSCQIFSYLTSVVSYIPYISFILYKTLISHIPPK
jgi:hypothetical protein